MLLKKIDSIRKKIMPKLTQNIGVSHFKKKVLGTKKTKIKSARRHSRSVEPAARLLFSYTLSFKGKAMRGNGADSQRDRSRPLCCMLFKIKIKKY